MESDKEQSILADRTIVERKGDDRLDRQVHHVIHHPIADWVHEVTALPETAPQSEKDEADIVKQVPFAAGQFGS